MIKRQLPTGTPSIVVVGSVNLDLSASVKRLPAPGETITNAYIAQHPGGKGANQALAARRLGADVALLACVGDDANADQALTLLKQDGVDLDGCMVDPDTPTGLALIAVDPDGENQIVVAPSANRSLRAEKLKLPTADALICQLEVPIEAVAKAIKEFVGFVCLNLAPATDIPEEILQAADLIVVNQTEAAFYGDRLNHTGGLVVITLGAEGAKLLKDNEVIASARPPAIQAVDATGAGDTFTAALTLALIEQQGYQQALEFACAAGAYTATKAGAQTSLPWRRDVELLIEKTH